MEEFEGCEQGNGTEELLRLVSHMIVLSTYVKSCFSTFFFPFCSFLLFLEGKVVDYLIQKGKGKTLVYNSFLCKLSMLDFPLQRLTTYLVNDFFFFTFQNLQLVYISGRCNFYTHSPFVSTNLSINTDRKIKTFLNIYRNIHVQVQQINRDKSIHARSSMVFYIRSDCSFMDI